jgi:hypothetical protein
MLSAFSDCSALKARLLELEVQADEAAHRAQVIYCSEAHIFMINLLSAALDGLFQITWAG